ncbi:hypothetical protein Dimus_028927, partial [Dionaea muscipula]
FWFKYHCSVHAFGNLFYVVQVSLFKQWHWEYATNGNEFMLQNGCCRIHVAGDGALQNSCCRMGVATKSTNHVVNGNEEPGSKQ